MDIQEGDWVKVNDEFFTEAGPHKNAEWALKRSPVYVWKVLHRKEARNYGSGCGSHPPEATLVVLFEGAPYAPIQPGHVELIHRCRLRPGDRARLNGDPEITEEKSWGWVPYRHTLVEGREGTISGIWCPSDEVVRYYWVPDDQTWISSSDGVERPVDEPSVFCFGERWLDPVTARVEDAA